MNKERINYIIQWLETGAIHVTEDGEKIGFDMAYWNAEPDEQGDNPEFPNECGTAMCIGGAAEQFFGDREDKFRFSTDLSPEKKLYEDEHYTAHLLGLPFEQAYSLFYPWNEDWYKEGGSQPLTPKYMAGVLRWLVDTGELVG